MAIMSWTSRDRGGDWFLRPHSSESDASSEWVMVELQTRRVRRQRRNHDIDGTRVRWHRHALDFGTACTSRLGGTVAGESVAGAHSWNIERLRIVEREESHRLQCVRSCLTRRSSRQVGVHISTPPTPAVDTARDVRKRVSGFSVGSSGTFLAQRSASSWSSVFTLRLRHRSCLERVDYATTAALPSPPC